MRKIKAQRRREEGRKTRCDKRKEQRVRERRKTEVKRGRCKMRKVESVR